MLDHLRPSGADRGRPWSALAVAATTLALVVAGAGPAAAQARLGAEVDPSGVATAAQASAKITAEATKQLKANKSADFWIKFGTKADLAPAYKIADSNKRGQFVYDTLRAAAKK